MLTQDLQTTVFLFPSILLPTQALSPRGKKKETLVACIKTFHAAQYKILNKGGLVRKNTLQAPRA